MSVLTNIDIQKENGKNIVISPFSDDSLSPLGYDLRVGAIAAPTGEVVFAHGSSFTIPSKGMVQIICAEFVWLSPRILGTIHSRGSFSAKGLILNSTTVDPNWQGEMAFSIFNFADKDIEINVGDRFATLILYYCNSGTSESPTSRAIQGFTNTQFAIYEYSEDFGIAKADFNNKTDRAKARAGNAIWYMKNGIAAKIRESALTLVLKLLLLFSTIILITLPFCYNAWIVPKFNLATDYSIAHFMSNLALEVSLIVAVKKK